MFSKYLAMGSWFVKETLQTFLCVCMFITICSLCFFFDKTAGDPPTSFFFFFLYIWQTIIYRLYTLQGSYSPKEKDNKTLKEILTPPKNGITSFLLWFDTNQIKLSLEADFPHEVEAFIIKDNTVSGGPNHPACSDNQFSEYTTAKSWSSLYDHVQGTAEECSLCLLKLNGQSMHQIKLYVI